MKLSVLKLAATRTGDDSGTAYLSGHVAANSVTGSGDVRMLVKRVVQLLPFTISLDSGTGSCDVDHLDVYAGHKLGDLPECTRGSDRFDGWFAADGTRATADTIATERFATLTARYTEPTVITLDAGSGSCTATSVVAYRGYAIEGLPSATGTGTAPDFFGWKSGTSYVANGTVYDGTYTSLTASYGTFATKIYAKAYNATYPKVGIHSASRISSSEPIVVSWGDGTIDYVYGSISRLTHEYKNSSVYYTIGISDNISTLAVSTNSSDWYGTSTHNKYNIRRVIALSPKITSMPSYAFYYCLYMQITDACIGPGMTSVPSYGFYYSNYYGSTGSGRITIPKRVTSVGTYAFRYCYYLNSVTFEERDGAALSIGSYAFGGICYYSSSTVAIPEGVTSIPLGCFYQSRYIRAVLPSSVASIGSYAFAYCTYATSLTVKRATAPTAELYAFGYSSNTMGYVYRTSGTNTLTVPTGATGYDATNWTSYLLNASYGGFTKEEADL